MKQAKLNPYSLDAEQTVLGSIMEDENMAMEALSTLTPTDFYREPHGNIFQAIVDLVGENKQANLLTITGRLSDQGTLKECGGTAYVASMMENRCAGLKSLKEAVEMVKEKSILRHIILICNQTEAKAHENLDSEQLLGELETSLIHLGNERIEKTFTTPQAIMPSELKRIEKAQKGEVQKSYFYTGLQKLDMFIGGMEGGDLCVVAGITSSGKTSFLLQMALETQKRGKGAVGIFSGEMSSSQLMRRELATRTGISSHRLKAGEFSDAELVTIKECASEIAQYDWTIEDTAGLTIGQVMARARKMKLKRKGLCLILVDHIQEIRSPGSKNREVEISEVVVGLKNLAKRLNVPVMASSHISRANEYRDNKELKLSDLRDSGRIEQVADFVLFLQRKQKNEVDVKLLIAKNRFGPVGWTDLEWAGDTTSFSEKADVVKPKKEKQVIGREYDDEVPAA